MSEEKLRKLLSELSDVTAEAPPPGLRDRIGGQIPARLVRHAIGWDVISIVIDTRLSKLVVAATITIATILLATVFGNRHVTSDEWCEDGRLLINYCLTGSGIHRAKALADLAQIYEDLAHRGKDAVYYGESADTGDRNSVLMYWRLADGRYMVVFNDLTTRAVSANGLIRLQSYMIQKDRSGR